MKYESRIYRTWNYGKTYGKESSEGGRGAVGDRPQPGGCGRCGRGRGKGGQLCPDRRRVRYRIHHRAKWGHHKVYPLR